MAASDATRCPGSDGPPARVWRERAFCRCCGQGFALKADGTVRRHADPTGAFVPQAPRRRKVVTQK